MTGTRYDVHGVTLEVDAEDGRIRDAVDRRLRHFRSPLAGAGPVDVFLDVLTGDSSMVAAPRAGRPVYDTPQGEMLYDEDADALWLDHGGRATLAVQASAGWARLAAARNDDEAVWLVTHPLLTLVLVEVLKRRARYPLHAAAVTPSPGRVVLLPGASGAGKTTLALALLCEGWGFLSDDMAFLDGAREAGAVLAFSDEVDVSDETCELLPALATPTPAGRAKGQLLVDEAFSVQPEREGRAVAVVFPQVARTAASVLAPLAPGDALAALAPNVLLTDPVSSQAHLDALAALVKTVPCWRLQTGRDFADLAAALGALV